MDNIRIGVAGVGSMGERHCRIYSTLRGVQLIGVTDLAADRGRAVAAMYDTDFFDHYEQLLTEVDAITIATTTPTHFDLARQAIERGIHVLVEKPLTETLAQGEQLVAEAESRRLVLQVGHIERFNPAFLELQHVIEGLPLIAVQIERLSPFDTSNTDVDVILDLMIHDLDLLMSLIGCDFDSLHALGRSVTSRAIDHAVANFSFREGPVATLVASRITEQKVRSIKIIAQGAYIEADLLGKSIMIHRRTMPTFDAAKYRQESVIEQIHVPMVEPLWLELRHFVDCVAEAKPPQVGGADGLRALKLAHTIVDQIRCGVV
ncbi:MAG: Gfo/Idh/MocA family oxidoreductase [Anaerolineae bacterium]|nr:Gfo/Idh/MocA family oxidoreductase [Anaerolineae bacterium]